MKILLNVNEGKTVKELLEKKNNVSFRRVKDLSRTVTHLEDLFDAIYSTSRETPVTVIADYDADGVTSGCIVYNLLEQMGFSDISVRLPKRLSEGYGTNINMIREIDSGLVLLVDNGISAIEPIRFAKEKGLKVLILDHHLSGGSLPEADVIVDQHVHKGEDEFENYCAAGLSLKLLQMATEKLSWDKSLLNSMYPVAMVGTIADIVDILDENQYIVAKGLSLLAEAPIGLRTLFEKNKISLLFATPENVSFVIAPCLNAPGRLLDDGANTSLNLLLAKTNSEASDLCDAVIAYNQRRKSMVSEALKELPVPTERAVIVQSIDTHEGIVGILAGELAGRYNKSAIVLTKAADGSLKGSGRAVAPHNLKQLLDLCQNGLISYGGHKAACGLKLTPENFEILRDTLNLFADAPEDNSTYLYDVEILANEIPSYIQEEARFSPFGEGFRSLTYRVKLFPSYSTLIGSTVKGLKMVLPKGVLGEAIEALSFNAEIIAFFNEHHKIKFIDAVGTLSRNIIVGKNGAKHASYQFLIEEYGDIE